MPKMKQSTYPLLVKLCSLGVDLIYASGLVIRLKINVSVSIF